MLTKSKSYDCLNKSTASDLRFASAAEIRFASSKRNTSISAISLAAPVNPVNALGNELQFESMMPSGIVGSLCTLVQTENDNLPYVLDKFPENIVNKQNTGVCFASSPSENIVITKDLNMPKKYLEMVLKIRRRRRISD